MFLWIQPKRVQEAFVRIDPNYGNISLGPDSAGSRVGVCNPHGGLDTVTVSDCHVVLGLINPDNFIGGVIKLSREKAYEAVKTQIADPLGLSIEDAAYGVIELLESQLRNYLESMILGKGYSPLNTYASHMAVEVLYTLLVIRKD